MGRRKSELQAREAALYRDITRLMRDRGAPEEMTPRQAVEAGLLTRGEVDLLAQLYGIRIAAGGRAVVRDELPS